MPFRNAYYVILIYKSHCTLSCQPVYSATKPTGYLGHIPYFKIQVQDSFFCLIEVEIT